MVIFTFFYCVLDLSCGECNVTSLYFQFCSVNRSVHLVCCMSDIVILLLNVMEALSAGGGALLDIPCMVFQIMCVLCM